MRSDPNREGWLQIDHPSLRRLFEYWDGKRGDRLAPSRADIDPVDITYILPHVFIYDVEYGAGKDSAVPSDYVMRLFGTMLVEAFGRDLTGLRFDAIFAGRDKAAIRAEYDGVAKTGQPLCTRHDANWIERDHVEYERLLMPLSRDGTRIDLLFGAAYFEVVRR